jgi:hypothetical protein
MPNKDTAAATRPCIFEQLGTLNLGVCVSKLARSRFGKRQAVVPLREGDLSWLTVRGHCHPRRMLWRILRGQPTKCYEWGDRVMPSALSTVVHSGSLCFGWLQIRARLRPEVCHERGETAGRSSPDRPSRSVGEMGRNSAPALKCPL